MAPNTVVDLQRYQDDLKALTPGNQVQLLSMIGFAKNFRNGYIESYTAGIDHDFRDVKFSAGLRGDGGGSSGQRLFPEQLWRRRSGFRARSPSSIPPAKPSEALGRRA